MSSCVVPILFYSFITLIWTLTLLFNDIFSLFQGMPVWIIHEPNLCKVILDDSQYIKAIVLTYFVGLGNWLARSPVSAKTLG